MKQIISEPKQIIDAGKWMTGKMPRSAFPLSKSGGKCMQFRGGYQWRVVKFSAGPSMYRLVVAFNAGKEQYYAVLGQENGNDMKVIARLEFHGTHPGWHVHCATGDISSIEGGRYKGIWEVRIPAGRAYHRRQEYGIDQDKALSIAFDAFGLHKQDCSQGNLPL